MQPDLGGIQDRHSGPAGRLSDVAPVLDLDVRRLVRIDGGEMGLEPEAMQAGQCLDERARCRLVDGAFVDTMSTEIIDDEKRSAENVARRFGPSRMRDGESGFVQPLHQQQFIAGRCARSVTLLHTHDEAPCGCLDCVEHSGIPRVDSA